VFSFSYFNSISISADGGVNSRMQCWFVVGDSDRACTLSYRVARYINHLFFCSSACNDADYVSKNVAVTVRVISPGTILELSTGVARWPSG